MAAVAEYYLVKVAAMALLAALLMLPMAACTADFYKFGASEGDATLAKAEDAGVFIALKGAPFWMYEKSFDQIVLYDNGYIGVGGITGDKTPFPPFPFSSTSPMIAVYWADVDTTNLGTVYYRETQDSVLLNAVRDEIRTVYGGNFAPTTLFIATWDRVGYCCGNTGPEVNSFQVVLATDGTSSYVMFRYGEIQWTTGDKSGGSGGFGGSEAIIGFNAGDRRRFVNVIGSGMPAVVNIETQTNVMMPGVFMFRTDNPQISPMPFALYPFGTGNGDQVLPSGDNMNSGPISLATQPVFYGESTKELIVYENGYIGLGGTAGGSSPQTFPFADSNGILAPFWADIARSPTTGSVYYRETTDAALLTRAMYEITLIYGGTVSISSLFVVTWDQVGYAPNGFDQLNTFQTVIATDKMAGTSYAFFLYDVIQWTQSATVGINAGDGKNYFTLPQSGTAELANLETSSNSGIPGEFILTSGNAVFYPFGPQLFDRTLGLVDDHSIFVYLRITPFTFYGKTGRNLRVYSNGYISVGGSFGGYCPSAFPTTGTPIVAPFWADADVSSGVGGIYFRETSDPCLIDRSAVEIRSLTGDTTFAPTSLFVATWNEVGYNSMHTDKLNTYQVVLAMDGQSGYVLFLYKDLQWTTSDACGGTGGVGSNLPEAGISAGDGMRSTALPFSGTSSILSLSQTSSAGVPGLYILPSGDGTVARVSSHYNHPKSPATISAYMDPKLKMALELETEQQSHSNELKKDQQADMKLVAGPSPSAAQSSSTQPHIHAVNMGGRLVYKYEANCNHNP